MKKKQSASLCLPQLILFNDLPLEIIAEIFLFWAENGRRSHLSYPCISAAYDPNSYSPVILISVCKLWHTICYNLPALWSSISILHADASFETYLGAYPEDYDEPPAGMLSKWLARSRSAPLEFNAVQVYESEAIATALLSEAHRWKTITVNGGSGLLQHLISLPPTATPSLEGVGLLNIDPIAFLKEKEAFNARLRKSPSVTRMFLSLRPSLVDILDILSGCPTEQLTELRILDLSVTTSACLEIFKCSPNLVHASFSTVFPEPPEKLADHPLPLSLPILQTLHILASQAPIQLLKSIVCTSLRCFVIQYTRLDLMKDVEPARMQLERKNIIFNEFVATTRYIDHMAPPSAQSHINLLAPNVFEELGSETLPSPRKYKCPVAGCTQRHSGWLTSRSPGLARRLLERTSWNGRFSPTQAELSELWEESIVAFKKG
ncbi:hypothetical protein FA15DRAFT_667754 [Coprinopsis marcescibilis]|uniref:Uncharacterized protein n=1 Tax=Coprinopsis marcescibilis TaxID=230819 RepID=A0A5C3L242_COPMA|nr:hypothetical protein FA15DRAFT_667754 [Coprinopsis marcescibilis]